MEESHSNLPTSHLLGSVPAVVSEEKSTTTYEVPEAIMQTFPPNNNRGGGSSHGYQTLGNLSATFSEKVTRTVRKFSPHLAAKMRPPHMPVIRGRPSSKKSVYICGQPRGVFVFLFSAASFILWFTSGTLLFALWAFGIGFLVTVLHASVRTPNLKARLNTFREEFRAVWRNYSEL
ncbi:PRA1 family protein A3 isoform X2 [Manihot esculenta]|uniref:PRA1 family protein A3 isoform X2 n=1 Tax=Manihot esculenta TaxID=3983 RepID=UPI001CC5920C|nr:PRA1 family protein A3 isoform X2 [Manihot esculenta]